VPKIVSRTRSNSSIKHQIFNFFILIRDILHKTINYFYYKPNKSTRSFLKKNIEGESEVE